MKDRPMKDVYLKIGAQDRLRMERIALDRDQVDALALVQQWLEALAGAERGGLRSHLDVRSSGDGGTR